MAKGDWRCDMYFGTTRCCLPLGHLGQHTGSNVEAVEAAPSKWASERARIYNNHFHYTTPIAACDKCTCLALEFDAIALESERNVCQILRGENSSTAALEPLRMSDAMDSYRDVIARERDDNLRTYVAAAIQSAVDEERLENRKLFSIGMSDLRRESNYDRICDKVRQIDEAIRARAQAKEKP